MTMKPLAHHRCRCLRPSRVAPAMRAQSVPPEGPVGPSPYDVVRGWQKPFAGPGYAFGGNSGVFAESPDRIFIAQRGEFRLPDPAAGRVRRLRRLDQDERADARRSPRVAQLPLHARRQRQGQGALDAVGSPLRGLGRPGSASHSHQPVRQGTPRLGDQRDVQHHLRLLERRQEAAEDARREERARQRRQRTSPSRRMSRSCRTAAC